MVFVEPDYFSQFHCIADKCRHSCCIGWEIDIDQASLRRFSRIKGRLGDKLRASIDCEPEPHFILDKNERCPFLNSEGLCELILDEGEDILCHICAEHPRFYNEFPGRCESGLGMCCEQAAKLLLDGDKPTALVVRRDGGYDNAPCPAIIIERDKILACLADTEKSFPLRLKALSEHYGFPFGGFDPVSAAEFYLDLEQMDRQWSCLLNDMTKRGKALFEIEALDDMRYERTTEYFVYRHFALAENSADAALRLAFCVLSTEMLCCLDLLGYGEEALRLYSAEIEYSDENIGYILDALSDETLNL